MAILHLPERFRSVSAKNIVCQPRRSEQKMSADLQETA